MTDRMDDCAQHGRINGELPRVALSLSDRCTFNTRKSGVTLHTRCRITVTPLGELEEREASTQGKPPSLSPGGPHNTQDGRVGDVQTDGRTVSVRSIPGKVGGPSIAGRGIPTMVPG